MNCDSSGEVCYKWGSVLRGGNGMHGQPRMPDSISLHVNAMFAYGIADLSRRNA